METSSGHIRLSRSVLGRCSGSEFVDFAAASSRAIGEFVSARRPSHMPIIAAATHQPMTKVASTESSSELALRTVIVASTVADPPQSRTAARRKSTKRNRLAYGVARARSSSTTPGGPSTSRSASCSSPSGVSSERTPTQTAAPSLPSSTRSRRPANASRSVMSSPT